MNCPQCNSTNIKTQTVTEWFPYGETDRAFQATFPAMTCSDCNFGWRDYRAEEAIDDAMMEYRAEAEEEKDVTEFTEKVRELLTSYQYEDAKEKFREALILLAAEL